MKELAEILQQAKQRSDEIYTQFSHDGVYRDEWVYPLIIIAYQAGCRAHENEAAKNKPYEDPKPTSVE